MTTSCILISCGATCRLLTPSVELHVDCRLPPSSYISCSKLSRNSYKYRSPSSYISCSKSSRNSYHHRPKKKMRSMELRTEALRQATNNALYWGMSPYWIISLLGFMSMRHIFYFYFELIDFRLHVFSFIKI